MSNFTTLHNTGVDIGYEYSTYILGTMFVMSEILPLLKGKSNGLLHALLCLVQGSKCLLDNVEEQVKKGIDANTQTPPV
tara:strand:- start:819 stop:1055 length:237 start_codon:yes stop_codon:yes gene_type:complete